MSKFTSISVRRNDIFISTLGMRLGCGYALPARTAFVCRRGGEMAQLVFQHPKHGGLSMITVSKDRLSREMERGLRPQLSFRLALAFGYSVDHIPILLPVPGRWYELRVPMLARDGSELPAGEKLYYQRMNGLHVFSAPDRKIYGYPARLVLGENDLRGVAPCPYPSKTPQTFLAVAA